MEVLNTLTSSTNTAYPLLKTSMGDLIVISARLVDEASEYKAPPMSEACIDTAGGFRYTVKTLSESAYMHERNQPFAHDH